MQRETQARGSARWIPTLLSAGLAVACASTTTVERTEVERQVDLSGYWNDTDSRLVAEEMIRDASERPWSRDFLARHGKKPTVIVGGIRNLSHEHLNTRTFVADLEREWVNSGVVRLVAAPDQRDAIRDERSDQARYSSLETAKSMGRELGADFILLGQIDSILDSLGGETVRFYQVELELIDIETNEKAWIGQKKLKKVVSRSRFKL